MSKKGALLAEQKILVSRATTSTDLQSNVENRVACYDAIHSDYYLPPGIKPALL